MFKSETISNEYAMDLLNVAKLSGFEAKLFSCFGTDNSEAAAFGMLNYNNLNIEKPGTTTL